MNPLDAIKEEFVAEWAALGPAWGMTRTVARVHALLMVSDASLTTDEIMDALSISRGSAHGALKELGSIGIVSGALRKGERRESFTGEKNPWKVFSAIMRYRKRREVEPVLGILERCVESTMEIDGAEARVFEEQLTRLREFVRIGNGVLERMGQADQSVVLKWMLSIAGSRDRR